MDSFNWRYGALMKRIEGVVKQGDKRGRVLGFPTANLEITDNTLVDGIYVSTIEVMGQSHSSLTFIGAPITFDNPIRKVETHILDFDRDIYGQTISIDLLKKLRDNQKFASVDELTAAMKQDKVRARKYFRKKGELCFLG